MLTRDLIKYRTKLDNIQISWLSSEPEYEKFLDEVLRLAKEHVGQTEEAFKDAIEARVFICTDHLKGMLKVLLEHCHFAEKKDLWQERLSTVLRAQALRQETLFESYEAFGEAFSQEMNLPLASLSKDFFADLPEKKPIVAGPDLSQKELEQAYHLAAVQGLLVFAKKLIIRWEEISYLEKRSLFRALKFNKLLAQVLFNDEQTLELEISGPLDLFEGATQYGLELSRFLHWAIAPKKWQLRAVIQLPKQKSAKNLILDQSMPLRSKVSLQGLYVPEEYSSFCQQITKLQKDWQVQEGREILHLGAQVYVVPDFEFVHISGKKVHLELFHKWHQSSLDHTLKALAKKQDEHLILGVSKNLLKDQNFAKKLETSEVFQKVGFHFKDFPTSKTVLEMLSRF